MNYSSAQLKYPKHMSELVTPGLISIWSKQWSKTHCTGSRCMQWVSSHLISKGQVAASQPIRFSNLWSNKRSSATEQKTNVLAALCYSDRLSTCVCSPEQQDAWELFSHRWSLLFDRNIKHSHTYTVKPIVKQLSQNSVCLNCFQPEERC